MVDYGVIMKRKNTKASGTAFEHRVKKHFEAHGWKVFRSAASKSCADLIAFDRYGRALWIQCKASKMPTLGAVERMDLHAGQKFYHVTALVVCREPKTWRFSYYMFDGATYNLIQTSSNAFELEYLIWPTT